jgi:hypothetical protein
LPPTFAAYILEIRLHFEQAPIFYACVSSLTIGTGRKARVILEEGKQSRDIDLERGFAQGDGPSPRLYNVYKMLLMRGKPIFELVGGNRPWKNS